MTSPEKLRPTQEPDLGLQAELTRGFNDIDDQFGLRARDNQAPCLDSFLQSLQEIDALLCVPRANNWSSAARVVRMGEQLLRARDFWAIHLGKMRSAPGGSFYAQAYALCNAEPSEYVKCFAAWLVDVFDHLLPEVAREFSGDAAADEFAKNHLAKGARVAKNLAAMLEEF
jgi:hypothetical protein